MSELRKIKRAMISVSDKTGLAELAAVLSQFAVEIISTGGTAKFLRENGFTVTDVSDVTGFPEMMDGRVKTLHPKIHGAFLALRDNDEHVASMSEHGIEPIDLVVVNLYPFEQTISKEEDVTLEAAVENIDIGGPAMIRSASKNWRDVAVVTGAEQYDTIISELNANHGSLSLETRRNFAAAAYGRTARYDMAISAYLAMKFGQDQGEVSGLGVIGEIWKPRDLPSTSESKELFPKDKFLGMRKVSDLRYGENPHQKAALYSLQAVSSIATAEQLHGKEMSFNNYVDADAAWQLVNDIDELAVAIIKHTNPSGVGLGVNNFEAYKRALSTDPVSAFGGIVAFNRNVDRETANAVIDVFSEVIIAPGYDDDALEAFRSKKNLRVLRLTSEKGVAMPDINHRQITGGFLAQESDCHRLRAADLKVVTKRQPTDHEIQALLFAWTVCKHVKSNAIVFADGHQTLGVGAGQMNRVDSVRIAAMRAERFDLSLKGSAMASDAFFPFRDSVDEAAKLGISAIIQPGGSVKDDDSIAAANEHGIAMAFTGIRHFRH